MELLKIHRLCKTVEKKEGSTRRRVTTTFWEPAHLTKQQKAEQNGLRAKEAIFFHERCSSADAYITMFTTLDNSIVLLSDLNLDFNCVWQQWQSQGSIVFGHMQCGREATSSPVVFRAGVVACLASTVSSAQPRAGCPSRLFSVLETKGKRPDLNCRLAPSLYHYYHIHTFIHLPATSFCQNQVST
jgi:hypothetical protein